MNPAAAAVFGWKEEQAIGKVLQVVPPKNRHELHALLERAWSGDAVSGLELRWLRKDGSPVHVQLWTADLRNSEGAKAGILCLLVDVTVRKRAEASSARCKKASRALLARLEKVREQERQTVAREIHDLIGHALTDWKFDLAWLARRLGEAGIDGRRSIRRRIAAMTRGAQEQIESVHRLANELRPAVLDQLGLVAAIQWQARTFRARAGVDCQLEVPDPLPPLDPAHATAMFRILQEILSNVARHAQATGVEIRLTADGRWVELRVRDNGRGIARRMVKSPHALGLLGMRERAADLGGKMTIRGARSKGTTVTVRVPADADRKG